MILFILNPHRRTVPARKFSDFVFSESLFVCVCVNSISLFRGTTEDDAQPATGAGRRAGLL